MARSQTETAAHLAKELEKQVRELQRMVGKQAMTIEIPETAREAANKSALVQRAQAVTRHPTAPVCRALGVAGATAYLRARNRDVVRQQRATCQPATDDALLASSPNAASRK